MVVLYVLFFGQFLTKTKYLFQQRNAHGKNDSVLHFDDISVNAHNGWSKSKTDKLWYVGIEQLLGFLH